MDTQRFSASKFLDFFDYLISKGLMNKETASSRRVASTKIIDILEDSEKANLSTIDREHVFARFVNLKGKDYNPQSLAVYKSRFSAALDDFIAWATDPVNFKPSISVRGGKRQKKGESKGRQIPEIQPVRPLQKKEDGDAGGHVGLTGGTSGEHLTIPIPLRRGLVVKVQGLPIDLTKDEAGKIAAVISAYAVAISEGAE